MRIKFCILKVILQHYPFPSAWKPSPCLGQGCICSTQAQSRLFSSPELLTLHAPVTCARTRVQTATLSSVKPGFLLILILILLFILSHRNSCKTHSRSCGAARLHTATVPWSRGAVFGCGCSSPDGKLGSLAGQAPRHWLALAEVKDTALPNCLLPVCLSIASPNGCKGQICSGCKAEPTDLLSH